MGFPSRRDNTIVYGILVPGYYGWGHGPRDSRREEILVGGKEFGDEYGLPEASSTCGAPSTERQTPVPLGLICGYSRMYVIYG